MNHTAGKHTEVYGGNTLSGSLSKRAKVSKGTGRSSLYLVSTRPSAVVERAEASCWWAQLPLGIGRRWSATFDAQGETGLARACMGRAGDHCGDAQHCESCKSLFLQSQPARFTGRRSSPAGAMSQCRNGYLTRADIRREKRFRVSVPAPDPMNGPDLPSSFRVLTLLVCTRHSRFVVSTSSCGRRWESAPTQTERLGAGTLITCTHHAENCGFGQPLAPQEQHNHPTVTTNIPTCQLPNCAALNDPWQFPAPQQESCP